MIIIFRWKWPKAGVFMEKIIVPFTLLTVIFILTAGVYINIFIFKMITSLMVAAGFVVAISGYIMGAALAWIFRQVQTSQYQDISWEQLQLGSLGRFRLVNIRIYHGSNFSLDLQVGLDQSISGYITGAGRFRLDIQSSG